MKIEDIKSIINQYDDGFATEAMVEYDIRSLLLKEILSYVNQGECVCTLMSSCRAANIQPTFQYVILEKSSFDEYNWMPFGFKYIVFMYWNMLMSKIGLNKYRWSMWK